MAVKWLPAAQRSSSEHFNHQPNGTIQPPSSHRSRARTSALRASVHFSNDPSMASDRLPYGTHRYRKGSPMLMSISSSSSTRTYRAKKSPQNRLNTVYTADKPLTRARGLPMAAIRHFITQFVPYPGRSARKERRKNFLELDVFNLMNRTDRTCWIAEWIAAPR